MIKTFYTYTYRQTNRDSRVFRVIALFRVHLSYSRAATFTSHESGSGPAHLAPALEVTVQISHEPKCVAVSLHNTGSRFGTIKVGDGGHFDIYIFI